MTTGSAMLSTVMEVDDLVVLLFFFQAEDGIRDLTVTGVQTCALPISRTLEPRGLPARHATRAVAAAAARVAGAPRVRGHRDAALPVPGPLEPGTRKRRGGGSDAAPRAHLPAGRGRVPAAGAQAPLHPDADSSARAREARRDRRPGQAHDPLTGVIEIYTDGACRGNPGPGGWAALLQTGEREKELHGAEALTTNNRMELTAVIRALEALKRPVRARVYTDSEYVRRGITEWLTEWKSRGRRTAARQPVKNQDLWERLHELPPPHWPRGHLGARDRRGAR